MYHKAKRNYALHKMKKFKNEYNILLIINKFNLQET